jgi:hypothetical protein
MVTHYLSSACESNYPVIDKPIVNGRPMFGSSVINYGGQDESIYLPNELLSLLTPVKK